MFSHTQREAVRVKVKKCEANVPHEWRKFSIDPQITSLDVLYSLLAKAFDIKSDFSIKYKAFDPAGNEIYLSILSDWDLDAAFLRIHNLSVQTETEPCLTLQIDIKPFTEIKEWDGETSSVSSGGGTNSDGNSHHNNYTMTASATQVPANVTREIISPLQQSISGVSQKYVLHMQNKLPGLIMNQMEKTFSMVQKAFNLSEETMASLPPRAPLSDTEFRHFLDALGQIQRSDDLRKVIFFGGIDSSLRRVVWKHILNVYPSGMNGHQRMTYMRRKSEHYHKLRDTWKTAIKQGCIAGELSYVTSMVKKDVLRTDRLHSFYAGSDDNQNIASLFNILTTYALNHPSVSYCQGMSDIASPLLVTMNDEAQAYICFCAIMSRVRGNFMLDGIAMTQKFSHLTEALSFYDPEFWDYLKSQQADDLLFCYRWLLLELKREFPFEDALRMLEVQWSSLKYETNVDKELNLFEKEFVPIHEKSAPSTASSLGSYSYGSPIPASPSYLLIKPRENPYTKVCAIRRQSSSASLTSLGSPAAGGTHFNYGGLNAAASVNKLDTTKRLNQSLDDNLSRNSNRRHRRISSKSHQSLDETRMLSLIDGDTGIAGCNMMKKQNNEIVTDLTTIEHATNTTLNTMLGAGDGICTNALEFEDDEVFMSSAANSNSPPTTTTTTMTMNFHHTNPFAEDAQCNAKQFSTQQSKRNKEIKNDMDTKKMENYDASNEDDNDSSHSSDETELKVKLAQIPKGIAKLQNKNILSNYNAVSNIIAKQLAANASNVSESVKRVGTSGGGHFKDLKEKIAATSRKGMSFDDFNGGDNNEKSQQKLVKNFNEFLTFASINKNRIADKFATPTPTSNNNINETQSITSSIKKLDKTPHPLVQLTRIGLASSLDDSDSSSLPDTTWSGSTAATAIQQLNTLSNHSLHLELTSSLTSTAMQTPERTSHYELNKINDGSTQTNVASHATSSSSLDANSPPDDGQDQDYYPMTTAITRELRLDAENLDRQVFGVQPTPAPPTSRKDLLRNSHATSSHVGEIGYEKLDKDSLELMEDLKENEIVSCPDISELLQRRRQRDAARIKATLAPLERLCSTTSSRTDFDASWTEQGTPNSNVSSCFSDESGLSGSQQIDNNSNALNDATQMTFETKLQPNPFIDDALLLDTGINDDSSIAVTNDFGNSLPEVLVPVSTIAPADATSADMNASTATDAAEIAFTKSPQKLLNGSGLNLTDSPVGIMPTPPVLPPPNEFGGGNPFLMFLCLTLLLQHRNTIIKTGMDYNEIAMHFDKMVRKHDVTRVLNQARRMYIDYLKVQNAYRQQIQQINNAAKCENSNDGDGDGDINKNSNMNSNSNSNSNTNTMLASNINNSSNHSISDGIGNCNSKQTPPQTQTNNRNYTKANY